MTIVNDEKKFIFIHVPKNAGTSMYQVFGNVSPDHDWHAPARALRKLVPGFADYYKFAIIRNPWDRMVSLFHMIKAREPQGPQEFNEWVTTYDDSAMRRAYLKGDKWFGQNAHWQTDIVSSARKPQVDYINDDFGKIIIDRTVDYENLHIGLADVAKQLGIQLPPVPHVRPRQDKTPYREFYNQKGLDHIEKYFAKDIKAFNYQF